MYFTKNGNGHHGHGGGGILGSAATSLTVVGLILALLLIVAAWRVFTKAGQPGWAAIIPFYNTIVTLRVAGKPWWWLLLMFVPVVNVVVAVVLSLSLAKSFGKGTGFGVLTFFFPYICIPILGFGGARYAGPGGQPSHSVQPYADQSPTAQVSSRW